MSAYTISKDQKSGLWYAHAKGYGHIPVFGSFSERKSEAMEYAKMYNNLPNRVKEIERKRKESYLKYLAED